MTEQQMVALKGIASEKYGTDDVEVDGAYNENEFSEADKGTWVKAWVWVSNEELEAIIGAAGMLGEKEDEDEVEDDE